MFFIPRKSFVIAASVFMYVISLFVVSSSRIELETSIKCATLHHDDIVKRQTARTTRAIHGSHWKPRWDSNPRPFCLILLYLFAPCRQTLETPQTRRSNARSRAAQFALSEEVQTPTVSRKPSTTPILAGLEPADTSADSSLADYLNSSASESDHRRGLSGGGMICTCDL